MLQGLDIKPQAAHRLRDLFAVFPRRRPVFAGETRDRRAASGQGLDRTIGAQHAESAAHLTELRIKRRQFDPPCAVAEKAVKRRFDGRQVALDLGHHLRHRQAFLRLARHLVQHRQRRVTGLAGETGVQSRPHRQHLPRKLGRKPGEVFDRALGQQQGGGGLQRDRLGDAAGIVGHPHGHRGNRAHQQRQVGLIQRRDALLELRGLIAKTRQFMRVAGRKAGPLVLGDGDDLAQGAQVGFMRTNVAALRRVRRDRLIKPVDATNLQHLRALHAASGDEIQGVAQQPFGDVLRAIHQALHLQVDAGAQAFGFDPGLRSDRDQGFGEADGDPPERAMLRQRLGAFDRPHRLGHFAQGGVVGGVAQPAQQAGLEAPPLPKHEFAHVGRQFRRLAARRPRRQVGEKQFGFDHPLGAAHFHHRLEGRKQAHRLMRRTIDQLVQIHLERVESAGQHRGDVRCHGNAAAIDAVNQAFRLLGQAGHTI